MYRPLDAVGEIDPPAIDPPSIVLPVNAGFAPPLRDTVIPMGISDQLAAMVKNRILPGRNVNLRKKFRFRVAGEAVMMTSLSTLRRCSAKSML